MAEETVVAASSAAAVEPIVAQFDGWDDEGTPVVTQKADTPKPEGADSAAAETTTEDAPDSAGKKTQERRKPDVESRFKKLTDDHKAAIAKLEKDLAEARKPKDEKAAESSTARQAEKQPAQPEATRPKPKVDAETPDGKRKYASYEEYQEDLTDWKVEQKLAAREREQEAKQQNEAMRSRFEEAKERYTDYESVAKPVFVELMKPDIPREVFAVLDQSPVLMDLLYTIGGTEATKADFLDACRTNPAKALRVALLMEQEIVKELEKGKAAKKEDGETTPVTTKPRAPKPPSEVGGRGAPNNEDALMTAAKAGDFRSFDAEQTRRVLASRR